MVILRVDHASEVDALRLDHTSEVDKLKSNHAANMDVLAERASATLTEVRTQLVWEAICGHDRGFVNGYLYHEVLNPGAINRVGLYPMKGVVDNEIVDVPFTPYPTALMVFERRMLWCPMFQPMAMAQRFLQRLKLCPFLPAGISVWMITFSRKVEVGWICGLRGCLGIKIFCAKFVMNCNEFVHNCDEFS